MKKTIIFLLAAFVIGCGIYYRQGVLSRLSEDLILAAYEGNLTGVKNALEEGAEITETLYINDDSRHYKNAQMTPLLAAASGGNEKILLHLIKQGLPAAQANRRGWTPLFVAVRDGHAEAAAILVQEGANINAQTDTGATALLLAVVTDFESEKQKLSLIEYLLKRGADPNLSSVFHTDPLFYAVARFPQAVELLLSHGADPCRIYEGKTLLQTAKENKKSAAVLPALKKALSSCRTN